MKINKFLFFLSALFLLSIIIVITPTSYWLFYKNYGNTDNHSHYHKAYAATIANSNTKSFRVTIPKGSANPQFDISKLGPRQWYLPREITVRVNDTVTWINKDTEAHTVTSGIGAGIESLMNNKKGTPNGLFDSGLIRPGHTYLLGLVHTLISVLFILGCMA